jgi:hypothetical protein
MRSDLHQPTFVLSSCESDAFCEGTTISYAPGVPAIDCAPLGGACAETTDRPGACCGRSCSPDSGTACMGDIATSCVSGVQSRIDCARYGLHCTTTPAVACDGDAGSCKFKDPVQCNGPRATYCPASHLATFDCSKTLFPSHCNRGGLYLPCRAEEHDCKTAEWATCDGNSVVVCAGGWKRKVDCGALGFRTCGTPNSGPAVCVK